MPSNDRPQSFTKIQLSIWILLAMNIIWQPLLLSNLLSLTHSTASSESTVWFKNKFRIILFYGKNHFSISNLLTYVILKYFGSKNPTKIFFWYLRSWIHDETAYIVTPFFLNFIDQIWMLKNKLTTAKGFKFFVLPKISA